MPCIAAIIAIMDDEKILLTKREDFEVWVAVTCPKTELEPAESMTCTASGTAMDLTGSTIRGYCGQYPNTPLYENEGTAKSEYIQGQFVEDIDASHYCNPPKPCIEIVKKTNGFDANDPGMANDFPQIMPGDPVTWTYEVKNCGNVNLTNVIVTDDQGVAVIKTTDPAHPVLTDILSTHITNDVETSDSADLDLVGRYLGHCGARELAHYE